MITYQLHIKHSNTKIDVFEMGNGNGKTCLITAGIHGAEETSIVAALELINSIDENEIIGKIILVPICNPYGFYTFSKQVVPEDQKNLNRVFPGNMNGTISEKIAYTLEHELVSLSDYHIDLHGADVHEEVMPFVYYAGKTTEEVIDLSRIMASSLDVSVIVQSTATTGAYNYSAFLGKPSILVERGGATRKSQDVISQYKQDLIRVLATIGILPKKYKIERQYPLIDIKDARYPLANFSGFWFPKKSPGEIFENGETLGVIQDIHKNTLQTVVSEGKGIILYQVHTFGISAGSETVAYGLFHPEEIA
ncbi:M14 family metallopeptidase [Marinisporobacter balticus]|uniref:Succinylglutamate desuccinylase/Aspartoacylase catalytic domain-containing protein n=1 Tax=Marinisporobacter balticus TaxID=2018667 RepID=A0A4R2K821_9FIRM|nr:M14 family metallopeptidase [Marinisporobacter balticus]TCO68724.1 hypothetical protein EV214_1413 [Marinisporobacter balticus]